MDRYMTGAIKRQLKNVELAVELARAVLDGGNDRRSSNAAIHTRRLPGSRASIIVATREPVPARAVKLPKPSKACVCDHPLPEAEMVVERVVWSPHFAVVTSRSTLSDWHKNRSGRLLFGSAA